MNEVQLLKELGLGEQIQIAGWVLLASLLVRVWYQDHTQRLSQDIGRAAGPSTYSMFSGRGKRIFDTINAGHSYLMGAFYFALTVWVVILFVDIAAAAPSIKGATFAALLFAAMFVLCVVSLGDANKAVNRLRGIAS